MGVSQATLFNLKKKYSGLGVSELRKLRQLEEENGQLKMLAADLSLDKQILQHLIKKVVKPAYKKEMACWMVSNYRVSAQRACRCVCLSRSIYYYIHYRHRPDSLLKMRMNEIAHAHIPYGFGRIFVLLRREDFTDNHKRVYRIYKTCGLNLRTKRPRRNRSAAHRLNRLQTTGINPGLERRFFTGCTV